MRNAIRRVLRRASPLERCQRHRESAMPPAFLWRQCAAVRRQRRRAHSPAAVPMASRCDHRTLECADAVRCAAAAALLAPLAGRQQTKACAKRARGPPEPAARCEAAFRARAPASRGVLGGAATRASHGTAGPEPLTGCTLATSMPMQAKVIPTNLANCKKLFNKNQDLPLS